MLFEQVVKSIKIKPAKPTITPTIPPTATPTLFIQLNNQHLPQRPQKRLIAAILMVIGVDIQGIRKGDWFGM